MPSQTNIVSFVLRFVQETTDAVAEPSSTEWHGVIKHVQTNDEQHFARLADAIAFIARYVRLDEFPGIGEPEICDSETRNVDDAALNSGIPNPQ
jgi:hypothetical protein